MKTRYWLLISCLMGALIVCFGENCFLLMLAVAWGGGGILYFFSYLYFRAYDKSFSLPVRSNDLTGRKRRTYYNRKIFCEKWARILMYLGCIGIVEAVIIL